MEPAPVVIPGENGFFKRGGGYGEIFEAQGDMFAHIYEFDCKYVLLS